MNIAASHRLHVLSFLLASSAAVLAFPAAAADRGTAENYRLERERCMSGQTHQDRTTCLREARNAHADARRGRLDNGENARQLAANALARCQVHRGSDRVECERMVRGDGTVSGSVESGGVIRELVTTQVETAQRPQ